MNLLQCNKQKIYANSDQKSDDNDAKTRKTKKKCKNKDVESLVKISIALLYPQLAMGEPANGHFLIV